MAARKANNNREFFRHEYPDFWIGSMAHRASNQQHFRYQEISVENLDCFDGCSVVECGCGAGELLDKIAVRFPASSLYGIDLGRESLLWARSNLRSGRDIRLVEADVSSVPIQSNSVDRVLCSSVLFYLRDPVPAITELIRILKPGGRFVFDIRPPWHITNLTVNVQTRIQRALGVRKPAYSFLTPHRIHGILDSLPVRYESKGFFTLLPTRLPLLGERWGNWVRFSEGLSYRAGSSWGKWISHKLLVVGTKNPEEPRIAEL